MNIEEIRKRHESNDLWIEADTDGWQAHKDRGVLLERIAELEKWVRTHSRCPKCHGFLNGYSQCLSGCGYKDHWREI